MEDTVSAGDWCVFIFAAMFILATSGIFLMGGSGRGKAARELTERKR